MIAPMFRLDRQSRPRPHLLPAAPRVSVEILRGRVRRRIRELSSKVYLLGTASDCDLVLGDEQFPEAYAYIFVAGLAIKIRRLGTGPVLTVNDEEVESAELTHGDVVDMGPFSLRVIVDHPPRRGGDPDDFRPLDFGPASDAGTADAIDEIQSLLADIRQTLAADGSILQMYDAARRRSGEHALPWQHRFRFSA
jgi:hypothetical protein